MNLKYIITSTLVMLATFFMVSSAIAGAEGYIAVVDDIQVLGLTKALSTGPIEYSPEIKFETANKKAMPEAGSYIAVVDDIQVLGLTRALSTGPIEFSSGEMGNELNEYCAAVDRSTEGVAYSIGDEIQRVGMENAILPNC